MDSSECKEVGLCDEIEVSIEVEKANDKSPFAAYNKMRTVVNQLIEQPKIKKMKLVTNALSLNEDANEEAVLKGVNDLKEEIKTLTDKKKELEDSLEKIESDKVEAAKEKEVTEVVNKAAEEGRIEKDAISDFIGLGKKDLEGVKNTLAKMPVKKIANLLPVGGGADESRASWDYDKWQKEDGEGLTNMYKNARPQYDLLLEKFKTKNTK
jgi:ATP-dependent Clp protease protease subunit